MAGEDADAVLIAALATGGEVADAARQAGVSERTAYRRLADPAFTAELRQARAQARTALIERVVAKLTAPNTIETSYTLKGKPTTVNTRVISADGKSMTVTSTGTNAQGQKVNNHQVFTKS